MQKIHIKPYKTLWSYLYESIEKREILYFLTWRDLLVQYKQTAIGIVWVIVRPLLTATIFTIIFSRVLEVEESTVPYILVVLCAMLVWQFFIDVFTNASSVYLANVQLMSKVYFPRIFLPLSRTLCAVVDFSIGFLFYLFLAHGYYRIPITVHILYMPLCILWMFLVTFSITLLFATLIVRYRDFRHIVPFITQIGIYATPVGFSFFIIPLKWRFIVALNPFVGIINSVRWALLAQPFDLYSSGIGIGVTGLLMCISALLFSYQERYFSDII